MYRTLSLPLVIHMLLLRVVLALFIKLLVLVKMISGFVYVTVSLRKVQLSSVLLMLLVGLLVKSLILLDSM